MFEKQKLISNFCYSEQKCLESCAFFEYGKLASPASVREKCPQFWEVRQLSRKKRERLRRKIEGNEGCNLRHRRLGKNLIKDEVYNLCMDEVLKICIEEAQKKPKITVWNPRVVAVMKILKKTTPEFSMSREASKLLEEAVKSKYPELWKAVEEAMR